MAQQIEYNRDVQQLFLEMMLNDAESYARVQNIFNPQYFQRELQPVAKFIKNYSVNQITLRKMKEDIDYNFAKLDIYKKNYKLFFGKLMMIRRFKLKIKLFILFIFNIINNKNII